MHTYSLLREFADSWVLIVMVSFFLGTWIFAFWPSLHPSHAAAAQIPLRDDALPLTDSPDVSTDTRIQNPNGAQDFLKGADHE